jgi:periplasmic protein TonB
MMTKTNNKKASTFGMNTAIAAATIIAWFALSAMATAQEHKPTVKEEKKQEPSDQIIVTDTNKSEDEVLFVVVEESPEFPGGDKARFKYISENVQYPEAAREKKIQGTVFVSFVVEADGAISNVTVLRGIGGGCDEEAVRVIENMPKWTPGKQRGKNVRVKFNMPIKFVLGGEE